jgi:hypothetical protein
MVTRRCIHCEAEIEVPAQDRISCPVCGVDPDLPPLAYRFDDAPSFFMAGDPRRYEPIEVGAEAVALR